MLQIPAIFLPASLAKASPQQAIVHCRSWLYPINGLRELSMCCTLLLSTAVIIAASFQIAASQETGSRQGNDTTLLPPSHELYLLTVGPYPDKYNRTSLDPGWDGGPALIPAVRLAAEHINGRSDILAGFSLKLLEGDSGCGQESKALVTYVKNVYHSGKQVVGVIGPACSAATLALAPFVSLNDATSLILQSPSASSPLLNSEKYLNTFRTIVSSLAYVDTFLEIIKFNGWERVASFYDAGRIYFTSTASEFRKRVPEVAQLVFSSPVYDEENHKFFPVEEIRSKQVRVIFLFAGEKTCRRLMCIAYHMNIIFPTYQWILHDRTLSQLHRSEVFMYNGREFSCSQENLQVALHGAITNTQSITRKDHEVTISGFNLTMDEFKEEYKQKRKQYETEIGRTISYTPFANLYYDATWVFALSLNHSIPILKNNGLSLENYTYGQPAATAIIREEVFNVQFEGISGPIMFNRETRDSATIIDITQFWIDDNSTNNIGEIRIGSYNRNISLNDAATFINDAFVKEGVRVHLGVGLTVILMTTLAIVLTGLLQLANILWYNHRSIKATSPNLSHLISSGCYLFAITILIYSVQETFDFPTSTYSVLYAVFCNTFTWCLVLGYSLIFGTVCAKIWRVYRIFNHFRNQSPIALISDNALITFVIILLFLDMVLCTAWSLIDPWLLVTSESYSENEREIPTIVVSSTCSCQHFNVWLGILVAYKGAIALVVVALSVANRRIKRKEFQHTKKVNMLVYSLALVWGAGMPLYLILSNFDIHIRFLVMCLMLNAAVFLCSAMLFLPTVIPILKCKLGLSRKHFGRKFSTVTLMSYFTSE